MITIIVIQFIEKGWHRRVKIAYKLVALYLKYNRTY